MIQVIEQFIVNYLYKQTKNMKNGGWANLFLRVAIILSELMKKKRETVSASR